MSRQILFVKKLLKRGIQLKNNRHIVTKINNVLYLNAIILQWSSDVISAVETNEKNEGKRQLGFILFSPLLEVTKNSLEYCMLNDERLNTLVIFSFTVIENSFPSAD